LSGVFEKLNCLYLNLRLSFFGLTSTAIAPNVWPTGARRLTENQSEDKDRKFVRMLKDLMRRRHYCPREATLMKTGGAYEKLPFVPVAPVGC
jgi:hypothetical protein